MSRPDLHERHRAFREMQAQLDRTKDDQRQPEDFDPGTTRAVFERGPKGRLRLAQKTFRGSAFLDLRVEFLSEENQWTPTRKGVSIKLRELDGLIQALEGARDDA